MNSQSFYDKAVRSYLLTKYIPAANTCNKAIAAIRNDEDETLKLNIWTLYLNIASTLLIGASQMPPLKLFGIKENEHSSVKDVCQCIWNKLVISYGSVELLDPRLVSASLILDLKLNQVMIARESSESWFASLPDLLLDDITCGRKSDESYIEIVQLYTCRILPAMNDFESANVFLEFNSVLSDSKKKQLKSLVQEQQDAIKHEAIKLAAEVKAKQEADEKEKTEREAKAEKEAKATQEVKLEKEAKAEKDEINRIALLEKELPRKTVEIREEHNTVITPRSINRPPSVFDHNLNVVKNWVGQVTTQGAASYATILIVVFALLGLLRGQRGRLSIALQTLMNKLWQTIKMGTKVTYM